MYDIFELNDKSIAELKEIAMKLGIENVSVPKENLVYSIIEKQSAPEDGPAAAEKPKGRPGRKKKVVEEAPTPEPEKPIEKEIVTAPANTEENTPAEAPKRGRRPRIGKRPDVIKTTFENSGDVNDRPHRVSYPRPKPAVVDVANEILNENNEEEPVSTKYYQREEEPEAPRGKKFTQLAESLKRTFTSLFEQIS